MYITLNEVETATVMNLLARQAEGSARIITDAGFVDTKGKQLRYSPKDMLLSVLHGTAELATAGIKGIEVDTEYIEGIRFPMSSFSKNVMFHKVRYEGSKSLCQLGSVCRKLQHALPIDQKLYNLKDDIENTFENDRAEYFRRCGYKSIAEVIDRGIICADVQVYYLTQNNTRIYALIMDDNSLYDITEGICEVLEKEVFAIAPTNRVPLEVYVSNVCHDDRNVFSALLSKALWGYMVSGEDVILKWIEIA